MNIALNFVFAYIKDIKMPIRFSDHPDFTPDYTPREIIKLGSFGGTYWRSIHSSVTGKDYKDVYKKYDSFKNLPKRLMTKKWEDYDSSINKYKVKVGTTLPFWESQGWINPQDPYGWLNWYVEYYEGRRSPDDARQIKRWKGVKSRFDLPEKSDAVKQTLLQWGIRSD